MCVKLRNEMVYYYYYKLVKQRVKNDDNLRVPYGFRYF